MAELFQFGTKRGPVSTVGFAFGIFLGEQCLFEGSEASSEGFGQKGTMVGQAAAGVRIFPGERDEDFGRAEFAQGWAARGFENNGLQPDGES